MGPARLIEGTALLKPDRSELDWDRGLVVDAAILGRAAPFRELLGAPDARFLALY